MDVDPVEQPAPYQSLKTEPVVYMPKKRQALFKQRRRLIIDPVMALSVTDLQTPDRYRSSQRCTTVIDDAVQLSDVYEHIHGVSLLDPLTDRLSAGSKPFKQLVRTGGRAQMSTVLLAQYRARAVMRPTAQPLDTQFFWDMCGELYAEADRQEESTVVKPSAARSLNASSPPTVDSDQHLEDFLQSLRLEEKPIVGSNKTAFDAEQIRANEIG